LTIGLSAFLYGSEAVAAIQKQDRAYTAAEAALRNGSSAPEALRPPSHVKPAPEEALLQLPGRSSRGFARSLAEEEEEEQQRDLQRSRELSETPPRPRERAPSFLQEGAKASIMRRAGDAPSTVAAGAAGEGSRFDFERRAPWYLYNESVDGLPGADAGAARVRIFQGALLQGASRVVSASISRGALSSDWSHAALQLRLHKPPGMEYDHWDRQASVGLLLGEDMQDAQIRFPEPPKLRSHFSFFSPDDDRAPLA